MSVQSGNFQIGFTRGFVASQAYVNHFGNNSLEFLDETLADSQLTLDVFAFDLDEPVVCDRLLKLARQGRLRMIL
jgi:hypothetical protein